MILADSFFLAGPTTFFDRSFQALDVSSLLINRFPALAVSLLKLLNLH